MTIPFIDEDEEKEEDSLCLCSELMPGKYKPCSVNGSSTVTEVFYPVCFWLTVIKISQFCIRYNNFLSQTVYLSVLHLVPWLKLLVVM